MRVGSLRVAREKGISSIPNCTIPNSFGVTSHVSQTPPPDDDDDDDDKGTIVRTEVGVSQFQHFQQQAVLRSASNSTDLRCITARPGRAERTPPLSRSSRRDAIAYRVILGIVGTAHTGGWEMGRRAGLWQPSPSLRGHRHIPPPHASATHRRRDRARGPLPHRHHTGHRYSYYGPRQFIVHTTYLVQRPPDSVGMMATIQYYNLYNN